MKLLSSFYEQIQTVYTHSILVFVTTVSIFKHECNETETNVQKIEMKELRSSTQSQMELHDPLETQRRVMTIFYGRSDTQNVYIQ